MIPVILDAKRGDIASTAEAYAKSAFESLGAHAITLSPFLGKDSIDPFLAYQEKGVFLLCKTSNPGAADLQDLNVTVIDLRDRPIGHGMQVCPYMYILPGLPRPGTPATTSAWWSAQRNWRR